MDLRRHLFGYEYASNVLDPDIVLWPDSLVFFGVKVLCHFVCSRTNSNTSKNKKYNEVNKKH